MKNLKTKIYAKNICKWLEKHKNPLKRNSIIKTKNAYMMYALSISHPVIEDPEIAEQILDVVSKKLLNKYGLKTLASGEEGYVEIYEGFPYKRDTSYHQGITWPWLLGLYYDALKNTIKMEKDVDKKQKLENRLDKLIENTRKTFETEMFTRSSIGTISEIYDSAEPYKCRGAFAQAWSVSEVLKIILNKQ